MWKHGKYGVRWRGAVVSEKIEIQEMNALCKMAEKRLESRVKKIGTWMNENGYDEKVTQAMKTVAVISVWLGVKQSMTYRSWCHVMLMKSRHEQGIKNVNALEQGWRRMTKDVTRPDEKEK